MKNSKEKFGERVGIIADLVGGQAELSRRSGISTVSIGSYLKGESDPSRERLVAMASAANVLSGIFLKVNTFFASESPGIGGRTGLAPGDNKSTS